MCLPPIHVIDEKIDIADKTVIDGLRVVGEHDGSLDWHKGNFVLRIEPKKRQRRVHPHHAD